MSRHLPPTPAPALRPADLRHALSVAGYLPGERFELAAIAPGRGGIATLWGRLDAEGLERAAEWLAPRGEGQNLYLLANPLSGDAVRRRRRRAEDRDCSAARLLLLDVDPVKVKQKAVEEGKAAPEDLDPVGTRPDKLEAAREIALELRAFLAERLGVLPALVSSGRGRQLWLRLEEIDKRARKRLVRALAKRFDRQGLATLDKSTHNVARLMRLPGGVNQRTRTRAEVLDGGDGKSAAAADVLALVEELDPPRPKRRPKTGARRQTCERGARPSGAEPDRVASALEAIPADDYETWVTVGMALASSDLPDACELWDRWSSTGSSYEGPAETEAKWRSFSADGGVGMGTLFHLAIEEGWTPPAPTKAEENLLPLLDVRPPARAIPTKAEAARAIRSVLRGKRRRREPGRVVQDRRPTGAGKTTGAARELVQAAAEAEKRYLWASPSHDLARAEVLPALAKAGAAVWDEDLDGGEDGGVRMRLVQLGAEVVPLGEPPRNPATPVVAKASPFACPGPGVPGWSAETVEELYQDAAARGWNPTATVCRACPRFLGEEGDPCPYWERRRLAADADVLVVPHHGLKGDAPRRAGLVVDEDPASALVKRLEVDHRGARAFLVLIDAALERTAARAQTIREELEALQAGGKHADPRPVEVALQAGRLEEKLGEAEDQAERVLEQAEAVEAVVGEVVAELARWARLGRDLADVYAFPKPKAVQLEDLDQLGDLARACERVLRDLAKRGERLADRNGTSPGAPANLLPFARELARHWKEERPAILHAKRRQGGGLAAMLPVVEQLPALPILALDATGDPALLELATRRPVECVEGELTARLEGVHLVDVPCGRRRWRGRAQRAARGGRLSSEALAADVALIVRHARRVGARRVGLVTFKFVRDSMREALEEAGLEVRALHYGGEVGSNAFAGWADLVVVAGTPFVRPEDVRLRAALEGAGVEELLAEGAWEFRRLPGGGTASVLVHPGEATRRAYSALVRARLEQSLGRAMRWDWTPSKGVLVLAEAWPTRHKLRLSTRHLEALEGPAAEAYDLLARAGRLGDGSAPREQLAAGVRALVAEVGGAAKAAELAGVSPRAARLWIEGARIAEPESVAAMLKQRLCRFPESSPEQVIDMDPCRFAPGGCSGNRHELTAETPNPNTGNVVTLMSSFRNSPLYIELKGAVPEIDMKRKRHDPQRGPVMSKIPTDPAELTALAVELAGGKTRHLQQALGFSPITIRRWKRGALKPGAKSLARLASFVEAELSERAGEPAAAPEAPGVTLEPDRPAQEPAAPLAGSSAASTDPRGETPRAFPPSGCEACGGLVGPTRCWGPADKCATQTIPQDDPAQPAADPDKNPASVSGSEPAQPAELPEEPPCCDGSGYVVSYADSIGPSIGECCPGCDRCEPDLADPQPLPELVEVPAGTQLPEGRIYAPALVPPEQAAKAKLPPAPPPALSRREEVGRGLEELRELAAKGQHPAWLRRAVERAKGLSSLCTWLGTRKVGEGRIVDQDLALERAQRMQTELGQGLYARRTWGHVVALLVKRGAQPREGDAAKAGEGYRGLKKQRGALRRARKAQAAGGSAGGAGAAAGGGLPDCKACGGSGRSSAGGACSPCRRRKARGPVTREPIVGAAAEALEARPVRRKGRRS